MKTVNETVGCRGPSAVARALIGMSLSLAVLGLLPVAASAAETYIASPTGPAADPCSQAMPCSLEYAVETKAANGDEVIVLPGNYSLDSNLVVSDTITLRGVSPAQRPAIVIDPGSAQDGLVVQSTAAGATLRDLRITSLGSSPGTALELAVASNVTAERVHVDQGDGFSACSLSPGGVLRDAVCHSTNNGPAVGVVLGGPVTFTYRMVNVTAASTGSNGINLSAAGGANLTINATNVIAIGTPADVRVVTAAAGDSATVNLDHSNYDTISASFGGGTEGITLPGLNNGQTTPPVFGAGAGNFHQAAGSPTIDMGLTNPLNGGLLDLDGEARAQGAAQDIGADEFTVAPPAGSGFTSPTSLAPPGPTGLRAAALKKCKKKFPKGTRQRKRCIRKAKKLPV